ncbi:endo-1,4-beta-xylanase [Aurantibacter crassamenti]|uniref:endo-1,4-beta-xylanase n=1 Tax=Aurantibacter crassamenti TaxID=1837375 RepID=UPI00193941FB|nr:endo-1,4-beta-xylanase [Aurantibacter crassamenti]MBM1105019.1 endo-1,4-beta-xylanase [Aurantibacter crassamenti]
MFSKAAAVFLIFSFLPLLCIAQYTDIQKDIDEYRKGTIIINAKPGDKIEIEQLSHEFWFGAAISNSLANKSWSKKDKAAYKEKFLENFNSAVTENAVKWSNMEREQGKVNYETVDGILEWTDQNNIPLRAHNIFWGIHKFVQPWLKALDDTTLEETLKNRALTLAARYKGRFVEYDLNNEMIHGNYYEERLGQDITLKMTKWVHEADPEAKLWLNDYDILTGNKLAEYMAQIRTFLEQGVPIAGIGVQGHLHSETFDPLVLKSSLDSLSKFNLPVRITEFNMPGQRSMYVDNKIDKLTPEQELQKAANLVDYYTICFANPNVTGILQWGFWEGATWIPASAMYRKDWSPTPAVEEYQKLIFKEWWTTTTSVADEKGMATIPAYFGKYKLTVNGQEKEVYLSKADGQMIADFR